MSLDIYRATIARLVKDQADQEKSRAQETDKIARLKRDIASLQGSITRTTTPSTVRLKQRQIASKEQELARAQKKAADIEGKLANKLADLARYTANLERVEGKAQRREDAAVKSRRAEEIRHAQALTRETQRQAHLHQQLRGSRLVVDLARLPEKIKVLFVAADPCDQPRLALGEEVRAIEAKIRASKHRDAVELVATWAARPDDLLQALNEHQPHIVHFSGHGSASGDLLFMDPDGNTKAVTRAAMVQVMRTMTDNIRVVVFNACFSRDQAEAITEHVDVAVGMNDAVGDAAARVFAAQFYSAIGFGRSVQEAVEQARTLLMLEGIPEEHIPELFTRDGVDASEVVLVRPPDLAGL